MVDNSGWMTSFTRGWSNPWGLALTEDKICEDPTINQTPISIITWRNMQICAMGRFLAAGWHSQEVVHPPLPGIGDWDLDQ